MQSLNFLCLVLVRVFPPRKSCFWVQTNSLLPCGEGTRKRCLAFSFVVVVRLHFGRQKEDKLLTHIHTDGGRDLRDGLCFLFLCVHVHVRVFTLLPGWNPLQRLIGFCSEISMFVFQGLVSVSHSLVYGLNPTTEM